MKIIFTTKVPDCCQCRNAENKVPAMYYVIGKTDAGRPYRGNICIDHMHILSMDGYTLTATKEYIDVENPSIEHLNFIVSQVANSFANFQELLDAKGGYTPTIDCSDLMKKCLADAYDKWMTHRGDSRRAYRK